MLRRVYDVQNSRYTKHGFAAKIRGFLDMAIESPIMFLADAIFTDCVQHPAHFLIPLGLIAATGIIWSRYSKFPIYIWLGGLLLLAPPACSIAMAPQEDDGLGQGLMLFGLLVVAVVWTGSVGLGRFVPFIFRLAKPGPWPTMDETSDQSTTKRPTTQ